MCFWGNGRYSYHSLRKAGGLAIGICLALSGRPGSGYSERFRPLAVKFSKWPMQQVFEVDKIYGSLIRRPGRKENCLQRCCERGGCSAEIPDSPSSEYCGRGSGCAMKRAVLIVPRLMDGVLVSQWKCFEQHYGFLDLASLARERAPFSRQRGSSPQGGTADLPGSC